MSTRQSLTLTLALPLLALASGACQQPWNSTAADVTKGIVEPNPHEHSRHIGTPDIELVSGNPAEISTDPCERLHFELLNEDESVGPLGVITHECGIQCHTSDSSAVQGLQILDVATLVDPAHMAAAGSACGAGVRYLVPGDPDKSCIYRRMADAQMPPRGADQTFMRQPEKIPFLIPASTSEASLVYSWIANCLGTTQAAPSSTTTPGGGA